MKTLRAVTVSAAVIFSLASCGGGGGSTSSTSISPTTSSASTSPNVALSTTNATQTVAGAFSGSGSLASVGSSVTALKATNGEQNNVLPLAADAIIKTIENQQITPAQTAMKFAAKSTSNVQQCGASGSTTILVNMAGTTLQAGDSVSYVANNCQNVAGGPVTNGTLAFTISSLSPNNGSGFSAAVTFTASNFTATNGSSYASLNGALSMSAAVQETNYSPTSVQVSLTSPGLGLSSNTAAGNVNLLNLDYEYTNNLTNGVWSFLENAAINNNGDVVAVQTNQNFSSAGCAYPSSGSAVVTGLNSSINVTANNNGTATLVVNSNGASSTLTVPSSSVFGLVCI